MADFKKEGNDLFKARKFAEACALYAKAIEADPTNAVLYNNRAAAQYELKRYDDSVADAKKSLSLSPTAKAHSRIGAAFWAMQKHQQALEAYEAALALSPDDATIRENIAKLKLKLNANTGTNRTAPILVGDTLDASLDMAIVAVAFLQIVGSLIFPQYAMLLWKALLACMTCRSGVLLKRQGLLVSQWDVLKTVVHQFAGQYMIVCAAMLFLPVPPMPSLMGAIVLYAIVDISASQRGAATSLFPLLERYGGSRLDAVRQNRDSLLINAAMCEIAAALIAMLTGNFMYGMLLLQFFLRLRYRSDTYSQYAWGYISQMLTRVFSHPRCPPMLLNAFEKLKTGMHSMAMR